MLYEIIVKESTYMTVTSGWPPKRLAVETLGASIRSDPWTESAHCCRICCLFNGVVSVLGI
jgi:hypothetical protein